MSKTFSQDREEKIRALRGKYVIKCDNSKKKGQVLYYQTPELIESSKRYWSYFPNCARAFETYEDAEAVCSKLHYNNPRVEIYS